MAGQRFDQQPEKLTINPLVDKLLNLDGEDLDEENIPDIKQTPMELLANAGKNCIIVNHSLSEDTSIKDNKFRTLTEAIDFVNTEEVSETNPWVIRLEGDYTPDSSELIILPTGCSIVGARSVIGDTVTLDFGTEFSMLDFALMYQKIVCTAIVGCVFKGHIDISFKGWDPETGGQMPFLSGGSFLQSDISPASVTIEMANTPIITVMQCNVLRGNFEGLFLLHGTHSMFRSVHGDIILEQVILQNCDIIAREGSAYGIHIDGLSDTMVVPHMINCSIDVSTPITSETNIIEGRLTLINCHLAIPFDKIEVNRLILCNCFTRNTELNTTLKVIGLSSGGGVGSLRIIGGVMCTSYDTSIHLDCVDNDGCQLIIRGVTFYEEQGNAVNVCKSGSNDASVLLDNIRLDMIEIESNIAYVFRQNCLWDDATDEDDSNYYSAKKIHELIST